MAAARSPLDEAISLALRLSPLDKVRLLEQVASMLERDLTVLTSPQPFREGHWGQQLVALLAQLDLSDWEATGDEDVVEWVARQRQVQMRERLADWDGRP